jgi:hypothetical protein
MRPPQFRPRPSRTIPLAGRRNSQGRHSLRCPLCFCPDFHGFNSKGMIALSHDTKACFVFTSSLFPVWHCSSQVAAGLPSIVVEFVRNWITLQFLAGILHVWRTATSIRRRGKPAHVQAASTTGQRCEVLTLRIFYELHTMPFLRWYVR